MDHPDRARRRGPRDHREGVPGRPLEKPGPTHVEIPKDIAASRIESELQPFAP